MQQKAAYIQELPRPRGGGGICPNFFKYHSLDKDSIETTIQKFYQKYGNTYDLSVLGEVIRETPEYKKELKKNKGDFRIALMKAMKNTVEEKRIQNLYEKGLLQAYEKGYEIQEQHTSVQGLQRAIVDEQIQKAYTDQKTKIPAGAVIIKYKEPGNRKDAIRPAYKGKAKSRQQYTSIRKETQKSSRALKTAQAIKKKDYDMNIKQKKTKEYHADIKGPFRKEEAQERLNDKPTGNDKAPLEAQIQRIEYKKDNKTAKEYKITSSIIVHQENDASTVKHPILTEHTPIPKQENIVPNKPLTTLEHQIEIEHPQTEKNAKPITNNYDKKTDPLHVFPTNKNQEAATAHLEQKIRIEEKTHKADRQYKESFGAGEIKQKAQHEAENMQNQDYAKTKQYRQQINMEQQHIKKQYDNKGYQAEKKEYTTAYSSHTEYNPGGKNTHKGKRGKSIQAKTKKTKKNIEKTVKDTIPKRETRLKKNNLRRKTLKKAQKKKKKAIRKRIKKRLPKNKARRIIKNVKHDGQNRRRKEKRSWRKSLKDTN